MFFMEVKGLVGVPTMIRYIVHFIKNKNGQTSIQKVKLEK